MADYYIDSLSGLDDGDGKSPASPLPSHTGLSLSAGDTVYFRRGSEYRCGIFSPDGEVGKPITFKAYGDGPAPKFFGSKNCSAEWLWEETEKNIYRLRIELQSEPGNVIFGFGRSFGTLVWNKNDLKTSGDWWFSDYGCQNNVPQGAEFLIYSEGNPALTFGDIEIALFGRRCLAGGKNHVRFEGLHFLCSGLHGYAQTKPSDVEISDCRFDFIGGCVWNKERRIRYGNAIEFRNGATDCKIENCEFLEIYDSCFTTQGGADCGDFENIKCNSNTMYNYGMAAYEIRDKIGKNVSFEFNVCDGAGEGFSSAHERDIRPSETFPEPIGSHILAWRIPEPTDGGKMRIMSNIFRGAPKGGIFDKRIAPAALAQIQTDF